MKSVQNFITSLNVVLLGITTIWIVVLLEEEKTTRINNIENVAALIQNYNRKPLCKNMRDIRITDNGFYDMEGSELDDRYALGSITIRFGEIDRFQLPATSCKEEYSELNISKIIK